MWCSRKSASASSKAVFKKMDPEDKLFYTYANSSSGMIEPEGVESLCKDLGTDHTDIKILMFAWKMKSQKQGYFALEEWQRGIRSLQADTITKLRKALPGLEKEDKQKCIDIESICQLLDLVLGSQFRAQVDYFVEYLKLQTSYKVMNMDQWMGFYRFVTEITFPDFTNYDSELAWPSILDDFVDWMKARQS